MSNFDELRDILTILLTQRFAPMPRFVRGLMGDGLGRVRDPENPDTHVLVRPNRSASETFSVFNKLVPPVDGTPILIGELPWQPGLTQVVGIDWQAYPYGAWSGYADVAPHGPTHEWGDAHVGPDAFTVYTRQLGPLRTYSGGSGSMSVYLAPYEYDRWGEGISWPGLPGLDLSPARPATGTARLMLTYLDLENNVPGVVTGTLDVYSDAVELPRPSVPTGTWEPSAWVRLYGGQSTVSEVNDIWDARVLLGRLDSPTGPAGGDLTGTYPNPMVWGLFGRRLSEAAPNEGDVYQFTGSVWAPRPVSGASPTGPAGGDLTGSYPNPTVRAWLGRALNPTPPNDGEAYVWTGTAWRPTNIVTQDELSIHAGVPAAHHDPVSLAPSLDNNLLGLADQQLSLDQQAPNLIFASPPTGTSNDVPTFRGMVFADLPDELGEQIVSDEDVLIHIPFDRWEQPAGLTGANRRNAIIGSRGEQCWIGDAADDCGDRGSVIFVPGRWSRQRALRIEPAGLNYGTNPLQRDGTGSNIADGWSYWDNFGSGGSATPTVVAHPDKRKGWLQRYTYTAAAGDVNQQMNHYHDTAAASFAPGDDCTFSCVIKIDDDTGVSAVSMIVQAMDAVGAQTGIVSYSLTAAQKTPNLQHVSLTYSNLPALTDHIRVHISVTGVDNGDSFDFRVGEINVEKSLCCTSLIWGGGGEGFSWSGIPHASTSNRSGSYVSLTDYTDLVNDNSTISYVAVVRAPFDWDATWPTQYGMIWDFGVAAGDRVFLTYDSIGNRFEVYANGVYIILASAVFYAGAWLHLVVTHDFTDDAYRLYLNGELLETATNVLAAPTGMASGGLGILYDLSGQQGGWEFAEFAIIDRVLTPAEVNALYIGGLPILDPRAMALDRRPTVIGVPAGRWTFERAVSTTASATPTEAWTPVTGMARLTFSGSWAAGQIYFEGVLVSTNAAETSYAQLEYYDVATAAWRIIPDSTVSVTGTTAARSRSGPLCVPLGEHLYRVTQWTSNAVFSAIMYMGAIVVAPGAEDNI